MLKRPLVGVLPVLVALALVAIPAGGAPGSSSASRSFRIVNDERTWT